MSVVHFEETGGSRDGGEDNLTNKRYTRTFQVLCSSAEDSAGTVLNYHAAPAIGDLYTPGDSPHDFTDADAVVVDRRATQDDTDNIQNWTLTVYYAGIGDPEAQPAEVEISPVPYQVTLIDDLSDPVQPVMNTAEDMFEDGITVDRTRFRFTVTKNVLDFDFVYAETFQDTLNEFEFMGMAPETCKLILGAKRVMRLWPNDFYWARTATIDYRADGWDIQVRDAGLQEIVTVDGNPTKQGIRLHSGMIAQTPQLLNGAGLRLGIEEAPVLITFKGYRVKDWTPLDLGW